MSRTGREVFCLVIRVLLVVFGSHAAGGMLLAVGGQVRM